MPTDQSDPVAVLREALGRLYANREGYEIQRACYEAAEMALADLERQRDVEARLAQHLKDTAGVLARAWDESEGWAVKLIEQDDEGDLMMPDFCDMNDWSHDQDYWCAVEKELVR